MPDDLTRGAFSEALDRFAPASEPYANMMPERLKEVMAERLADHDVTGYWEAELHLAEKTPPLERYIHDLGTHVNAWLGIMEEQGRLPYKGWALRHMLAAWTAVLLSVRQEHTPETFPLLTPDQSRRLADDRGIEMAHWFAQNPAVLEQSQAALERRLSAAERKAMRALLEAGDAEGQSRVDQPEVP